MILSTNPRTGVSRGTGLTDSSELDVLHAVAAAVEAAAVLASTNRAERAGMLHQLGVALEQSRRDLISVAEIETGLTPERLDMELTRCVKQFDLFSTAVLEGSYLEVTIDHAEATTSGAVPEIRRLLSPVGPVAVFGSSNFPFAFSVPGGDTASALAGGNPVIIKAHGSHPLTSQLCFDVLSAAIADGDGPLGTLGITYGQQAGRQLVSHPGIRAVSFTGSTGGGQALLDEVNKRTEPIPFYGELASINPLIVTAAALRARRGRIVAGLAESVLGSGGQLCTKPGVAFVPEGDDGDKFVAELVAIFEASPSTTALNERVLESFTGAADRMTYHDHVDVIASGSTSDGHGYRATPTVLSVRAEQLTPHTVEEAFGPLILLVRYSHTTELLEALAMVPKSLTATIHSATEDSADLPALTAFLLSRAGRIVYDGYPTGVRVSWAQNHGGPWPATNSLHSSVGVTSMRRFLRPIAFQNAPRSVLPEELKDGYDEVPRRVDGVLVLPAHGASEAPGR